MQLQNQSTALISTLNASHMATIYVGEVYEDENSVTVNVARPQGRKDG
jgi:hypothetical protein